MSAVWVEDEIAPASRDVRIERENHKLEKRLCRQVGQAIMDFNMIEEGDRVMDATVEQCSVGAWI